MGILVDKWNLAGRLVAQWKLGLTPAIVVADLLNDLGFTAVSVESPKIIAYYHGVRFTFEGEFVSVTEAA